VQRVAQVYLTLSAAAKPREHIAMPTLSILNERPVAIQPVNTLTVRIGHYC